MEMFKAEPHTLAIELSRLAGGFRAEAREAGLELSRRDSFQKAIELHRQDLAMLLELAPEWFGSP